MSREDLNRLNRVLNRFTTDNVQLRQTEKKQALELWQPIVKHIVGYVQRDARFAKIQIFRTGSYYERAKVGEPDEFDLMLVMDNLELDDAPYEDDEDDGMTEPPTGEIQGAPKERIKGTNQDFFKNTTQESSLI